MASWDNGGRGVEGVNQIGVANPSTFFNSFFPTGFGSNSSSTSALPNPPAANTKGKFVGFDSFVFGRQTTANSDTFTSPVATQPPPLGSYQCGGGDHQLFRKNPGIGAFQNAWPYGSAGFPFSGNLQFDSQFSFGSSAAATTSSPFGNESPSYSSSSSTFGTISSGFRSSTTGPFTRSLGQENSSANNVSVFAPLTRSNLGMSNIRGTRICSYAPTPEADNIFGSGKLMSISAMPFYQEKSHEELRLEDYQLNGRTGGFTPGFLCSTDNRQQPMSKCPVSDERTPPIEKYKPDDEDVMAMIPKLKCPEYYTEPSMEDLAANELKMPGFCCQVKYFVIGKRGYGSIKFLGETDVRNLDLESIVQFNNLEVMVCMDKKNGKPPVGQGLNKAAEITLLNVKCINKNTGKQYIDGPKVDKYKQLLMRKTADQGAEFVSFDPAKGEWKFKVQHF